MTHSPQLGDVQSSCFFHNTSYPCFRFIMHNGGGMNRLQRQFQLVIYFKKRKSQYDIIVIEKYLIVTCNFIGRRLVSPASCIFMKTIFCQSNCPRYVWSVMEDSTGVADNFETHVFIKYLKKRDQTYSLNNRSYLHYAHCGFCRFRDDTAADIASSRTNAMSPIA